VEIFEFFFFLCFERWREGIGRISGTMARTHFIFWDYNVPTHTSSLPNSHPVPSNRSQHPDTHSSSSLEIGIPISLERVHQALIPASILHHYTISTTPAISLGPATIPHKDHPPVYYPQSLSSIRSSPLIMAIHQHPFIHLFIHQNQNQNQKEPERTRTRARARARSQKPEARREPEPEPEARSQSRSRRVLPCGLSLDDKARFD